MRSLFLDELGYIYGDTDDGESSITAWTKIICRDWFRMTNVAEQIEVEKQIQMRTSSKDDHFTNGVIESVVRCVEGLMRTLKFIGKSSLGVRIGAVSPLLPEIVRHAGFLITRFKLRTSRRTPFEELRKTKFWSPILQPL